MAPDFNTSINLDDSTTPSLIIDKSGRVIAINSGIKRILPSAAANKYFISFFDSKTAASLNGMFAELRNTDALVKETLELDGIDGKIKFIISLDPLRSENNIYYLVKFQKPEQEKILSENTRLIIADAEIEKLITNKKVLLLIEKIKLSYPFSFIEKARIQKEMNELEDYFWIKDDKSKFILANELFAESLGARASNLENKTDEQVLPKYLLELFKSVEGYIKSTANAVILNSSGSVSFGNIFKNKSIVEFPLRDLDNNVVAIIGVSTLEDDSKPSSQTVAQSEEFLKHIPLVLCVVNSNKTIVYHSIDFLRYFRIGEKVNLTETELDKILEKNLASVISNYLEDDKNVSDYFFSYNFSERVKENCEIHLKKIFENNDFLVQIVIKPKVEKDEEVESKALMYDALIEFSPDAMFVYDIENLKFLDVNEAALKFYGYKRNEFLNMDLTDLYAPEDIQTLIETGDNKSFAGSYSGPWRHKKSDGTSILVEIKRNPIDYKEKKAHLNLVRDVSIAEEENKKIQLLEAVYTNTNELIIVTDKDGFITDANDSFIKRFGYPKRDLDKRSFITLVSDDDRAVINKSVFHSGLLKVTTIETEIKKLSGAFQKASVIASPIKNYNGDVESYLLLIRVEEEVVLSKDLKHTQEESTEKIDTPFLSNMFHEILTPINVILGFTQELGESIATPNDEQKEAIEIINENQKMLLQIMDNAVEYSSLEQKVIKFRPEEIKFVDILNELKEQTRKVSESRKVEFSYGKISSSLMLETDKQKFVSLLSLFVKFALQITKEKSIYLSASIHNENFCAVKIKDTPNAITASLHKAFSEVFSSDESTSRRNFGFSRFSVKLAKKLIVLLSVEKALLTKNNEPVEYALIFPLKFSVGEEIKAEVETVEKQESVALNKIVINTPVQPAAVVQPEVVEKKKTIDLAQLSCLYLEDQLDSQMLFRVQLKDLKSIEFAVSFEAALPLLKTKKFDFIVMDINLQGEYNGLDALRIIQKMPGYKSIPIIASTAYVQPSARDSFIAAGFTDFISKPLMREKLLDVLRNIF